MAALVADDSADNSARFHKLVQVNHGNVVRNCRSKTSSCLHDAHISPFGQRTVKECALLLPLGKKSLCRQRILSIQWKREIYKEWRKRWKQSVYSIIHLLCCYCCCCCCCCCWLATLSWLALSLTKPPDRYSLAMCTCSREPLT